MSPNIKFVFDHSLLNYHFHDDHPFNQKRVVLTKDLLEKSGQLSDIHIIKPREAEDDEILLLHEPAYIRAVKSAMTLSKDDLNRFGLGTEDTPVFPNMHKAASQIVGATLTAVDAVLKDSLY